MAADASLPGSLPEIPRRFCDLVMKGGITSGIVYPKAVCELAKEFTFRNIGGTSAGAIAAAAAAAAELGRQRGLNSFEKLGQLPQQLGAKSARGSFLFSLFQPQVPFTRLYGAITKLMAAKRPLLALPFVVARHYLLATLLSIATGVGFLAALLPGAAGWDATPHVFCSLVMALLAFLFSVGWCVRRETTKLPTHMLGLCTGMPNPKWGSEALTPWLTNLLNEYSGQPANKPLTFGHLWNQTEPGGERLINLEMMTTNLTHGRPYRLPFDERIFYFREDDFRKLFPKEVVDWMVDNARKTSNPFEGFVPLPETADLPVIVATRMSLSFPVLFSAIPLYAVDRGRPRAEQRPEVCWFSDGSICSNFPVHFFDSPLPRWPTFAINLMAWAPARAKQTEEEGAGMVYLPNDNRGGLLEVWNRFQLDKDGKPKPGLGPVKGMFGAIMNAMQNWVDNRQTRIPGYRDRIAHVGLEPHEGGMNLSMPEEVIRAVSERGGDAGRLLVDRFGENGAHPMNWDNHRWVRFRSTMCALEEFLEKVVRGYTDTATAQPFRSYEQLLNRGPAEDPTSYRYKAAQRDFANKAVTQLVDLGKTWSQSSSLCEGSPKPEPELRIMPRFGAKQGDDE